MFESLLVGLFTAVVAAVVTITLTIAAASQLSYALCLVLCWAALEIWKGGGLKCDDARAKPHESSVDVAKPN
jgi:hypothetical protein